MSCTRAFP